MTSLQLLEKFPDSNLIPLYLWTRFRPSTTLILESADVISTLEAFPGRNYSRNYYSVRPGLNDKKKYCACKVYTNLFLLSTWNPVIFFWLDFFFLFCRSICFFWRSLLSDQKSKRTGKIKAKEKHGNMTIMLQVERGTGCIINMAAAFMGTN